MHSSVLSGKRIQSVVWLDGGFHLHVTTENRGLYLDFFFIIMHCFHLIITSKIVLNNNSLVIWYVLLISLMIQNTLPVKSPTLVTVFFITAIHTVMDSITKPSDRNTVSLIFASKLIFFTFCYTIHLCEYRCERIIND